MEKEEVRLAMNKFLKMYFDSCAEVYEEINMDRITGRQFKFLKEIHLRKEVTLTELARHFKVSKPYMTEVINKFEESKIIEKTKSKNDKRVSLITLTDVGRTLATSNVLESARAVEKIYERLSPSEVEHLAMTFHRFGVDKK
ncbi:MAG: winged helix-turn-helix transcriptional regulator [Bacilli bacterium]|nr:winged helix-turn-helix transcriptional regulator [Bacilli bacterium]